MSELKQHKTGSYLCYIAGRLRILTLGRKVGVNGFISSSQQQATTATQWALWVKHFPAIKDSEDALYCINRGKGKMHAVWRRLRDVVPLQWSSTHMENPRSCSGGFWWWTGLICPTSGSIQINFFATLAVANILMSDSHKSLISVTPA